MRAVTAFEPVPHVRDAERRRSLRRYAEYYIAETKVPGGDVRDSTKSGFRTVAGYIFGKNKSRNGSEPEKMAMTAPVRSAAGGSDGAPTRISFVLPSKYDARTAPRPLSGDVKLRRVAPHLLAVRRFAGPPPSEARVRAERARVVAALADADLQPRRGAEAAETFTYGYHDPFITPNMLRRNEVGVMVDEPAMGRAV